jgi:mannose-1-phosphate guanylyltransferase/mannose-6-phosphate isomerase
MSKLFLFDIDGTLTNPRNKINDNMVNFLKQLRKQHNIAIVGGSDFKKAKEQLGDDILNSFDHVFSENGLVYYKNNQLIHQKSFEEYIGSDKFNELITFAQKYIDELKLPFKTSNFVEIRNGMINISPCGRACDFEQRKIFEHYDELFNVRKKMINTLKNKFSDYNLKYSIGGQISFDVFPQGWDKTFCLDYLSEDSILSSNEMNYKEIHFFGDKTNFGGNDYEIYNDKRVIGHKVTSPEDTMNQINNLVNKIMPVILCGGMGTRLFPLSRNNIPKQFLYLENNGYSLLQNTIIRLIDAGINEICLMSNAKYLNILNSQLIELKNKSNVKFHIFLEPSFRNTFPAIYFMLNYFYNNNDNYFTNLLFLPSDHIYDKKEFNTLINNFDKNNAVTLVGISPTHPETGYGYIYANNDDVVEFKEKPCLKMAEKYLLNKNYYWNSGMFLFNKNILPVVNNLYPNIVNEISNIVYLSKNHALSTNNFDEYNVKITYIHQDYDNMENISVDYALMEKIKNIKIIKYNGLWSDIGSYNSLINFSNEYIGHKSNSNYVNTKKQVVMSNVNNISLVETEDCILVSDLKLSQDIKNLYELVKTQKNNLINNEYKDFRPWGFYEVIQDTPTFKLKKITVYPGKKLSLQSHNKRFEHWTCLEGNGMAQINDDFINLSLNKSVFIKIGDKHRLINNGTENLVIIELQTGNYFGEDDIIRYEDDYGRIN